MARQVSIYERSLSRQNMDEGSAEDKEDMQIIKTIIGYESSYFSRRIWNPNQ